MKEQINDDETLELISERFNSQDNFLITCHVKPDGDAIGSMLSLYIALKNSGRQVIAYNEDPISQKYYFMPGSAEILNKISEDSLKDKNLIILDCNDVKRVSKTIINNISLFNSITILDHHEYYVSFFEHLSIKKNLLKPIEYIHPNICSTGTIIYKIIKKMNWPITPQIAINLYTAICFDTGGFRYSNTSSSAFKIASELVDAGANPYIIANHLFYSHSEKRQHLLSLVLRTLELKSGSRVGIMHLSPDMLKATGATEEDTGDFISYIRSIESVEVSVFIKEIHPNQIFVSLRSRFDFDVAEFAKLFGGGGHKKAAGFFSTGSAVKLREEIIKKILNMEPFNDAG
jgi:phosphoesterase RecJ-like protein